MEIQCLIFSFSRLKQFFRRLIFSYSCTMVTFDWETWHDGSQLLFLFRCDKHTRNKIGKNYVVLCHSYVLHCDWSCDKKNSAIFWSSCLNLNVWLFPSGIEFISFLKKIRKKPSLLWYVRQSYGVSRKTE